MHLLGQPNTFVALQFINNYFVLFYIAYIRPFKEPTVRVDKVSTMEELQTQLLIVFTGKTIIKQTMSIVMPKLARHMKLKKIISNIASDGHHVAGTMEKIRLKAEAVTHQATQAAEKASHMKTLAGDKMSDTTGKTAEMKAAEASEIEREAAAKERRIAAHEVEMAAQHAAYEKRKAMHQPKALVDIDDDGDIDQADVANQTTSTLIDEVPSFAGMSKKEIKKVFYQMSERPDSVEDEFILQDFDSTFDDFNEAAVQYGYLAIFAPGFFSTSALFTYLPPISLPLIDGVFVLYGH